MALIREFQDIFVDKLDNSVATGVPLFYVAPHKPFEGVKPRHYSDAKKAYMEQWVPEYLKRGIIKRSNSTTMSPVHVTEKTPGVHDGKFRVTVDASKLNDCMPMIHSMLPTVTERVQAAAGHKYYSAFDMPDSFFQLPRRTIPLGSKNLARSTTTQSQRRLLLLQQKINVQ